MQIGRGYLRLFYPAAGAAALAAALLLCAAGAGQRGDQEPAYLCAKPGKSSLDGEMLEQIGALPGFRRGWVIQSLQARISLEGWEASLQLLGVELSSYPLTIVESAGEKRMGDTPLLVAGRDFFLSLTGQDGNSITERQAAILRQSLAFLEAELCAEEEGSQAVTASFLGAAGEDGVYMDVSQLQSLAGAWGEETETAGALLEFAGSSKAEKAKEILEKAGISVERPPTSAPIPAEAFFV